MFLRRGIDDNEGGVFFLENKQSEAFLFTEEFEVVLKMGEKNGEQNSTGRRKFKWNEISMECNSFLLFSFEVFQQLPGGGFAVRVVAWDPRVLSSSPVFSAELTPGG